MKELWDDRVTFAKEIMGFTPSPQQGDGLKALDNHDYVSIASGHGCGKSAVEVVTINHYMTCRPFPKIGCTAPSKHQMYDVLWAELSKWHRKMNPAFSHMFEWTKERYFHKAYPEEWFASARTASKENPEALQGLHAEYVLVVVDEASGVHDVVFEYMEGATGQKETKQLLCANPTRLEGMFFDTHHKMKQFYKRLTWSCVDSPIVPPRYIERMKKKWGETSNIYLVRVLGKFPKRADDVFIPYDLAEAALIREIPPQGNYKKVFGVDVARYGDDETVIAIRQGDSFLPYHRLRNKSTMEIVGYLVNLARKENPDHIFIDAIGIGAGVFDRLEEFGKWPVSGVNVSESPCLNDKDYLRLRDELWGNMRTWLEARRGKLWDNEDGDLLGELTTPKFKFNSKGQIIIESKDDMKKRGHPSPNIADAHIMTFAQPVAEYTKEEDDEVEDHDDQGYKPLDSWAGY